MALIKYGWTRTTIANVTESSVTCQGGEVDGLSFGAAAIPDAKVGDAWILKIGPAGAFAFGQIEQAVKVLNDVPHRQCPRCSANCLHDTPDGGERCDFCFTIWTPDKEMILYSSLTPGFCCGPRRVGE